MEKYYYSTQPFLAWCLNHYFYSGIHFAYVGAPFYPYRLSNPRSSNPLRVYEDLYEPWKDKDVFSGTITQKRLSLRNGVNANASAGNLQAGDLSRLLDICDRIDLIFFYPIVYRVDITTIGVARLIVAGSGAAVSSNEYLIDDLRENEFDVLFADLSIESLSQDFQDLCNGLLSHDDALDLLEKALV